ncbi:MAG: heavy metal translocating P-type ATPase, partial [Cyclobacteriaceae bacterium]
MDHQPQAIPKRIHSSDSGKSGIVPSNEHEHHHHKEHGHDHHRMMIEDFKKRFWLSVVLSIPVLALSPMIQQFFGFEFKFDGSLYLLFGLASAIYFYGGWPFLKGLKSEVIQGNPGMMTLIAVAITLAYVYSSAVVFGLVGKMFFWELVTLIDIMILGHWIEMKSVLGASKALELLVGMMPALAHRINGEAVEEIKLEDLLKGDLVLIKPGEKVPADGSIIKGSSYLNESMLTGESKPIKKE